MNLLYIFVIFIIVTIIYQYYITFHTNFIIEGLNTFNGRMAIDDQYFYDKIFDNVTYYPNEYAKDYDTGEEIGKLLITGWMKCRQQCNGNCIEYGISGDSYCFK
jgi:hypothetical protein